MKSETLAYWRAVLFGNRTSYGLVFTIVLYALLIAIGFVYLYPLLFMFVTSLKSADDLLNPMVQWVPTQFFLGNYDKALKVLDYPTKLGASILVAVAPSLIQTAVCSVVGYGLARYRFPGKTLIIALVLATFIIPSQSTVIPQMLTYQGIKIGDRSMLGSILVLILPALGAQGFNSAIFILIFYQTFLAMPKVLEEAARLDGASDLRIFLTVGLPAAIPSFIVAIIFSVVWYWNETYLTVIFLDNTKPSLLDLPIPLTTLPMQLIKFSQAYENLYPPGTVNVLDRLNEAVKLAGTFLNILPLLVMYFVMQRWFVESVERTGITGE